MYRNATVAHSQSELAVTYAVGVLDSRTLKVRDVAGLTVVLPLPARMVLEFRGLVGEMERRLEEVLEPVRASLMKTLLDPRSGTELVLSGDRWAQRVRQARAIYFGHPWRSGVTS